MKIKVPGGFLIVEEKGTPTEYPGVWISFLKDGEEQDTLISCTEYDTEAKRFLTEAYSLNEEQVVPLVIFDHNAEQDIA